MPEGYKRSRIYFKKIHSGSWLRGLLGALPKGQRVCQKSERNIKRHASVTPKLQGMYIAGDIQMKVMPGHSYDNNRPVEICPRWEYSLMTLLCDA